MLSLFSTVNRTDTPPNWTSVVMSKNLPRRRTDVFSLTTKGSIDSTITRGFVGWLVGWARGL
jgi:hypothetical protein